MPTALVACVLMLMGCSEPPQGDPTASSTQKCIANLQILYAATDQYAIENCARIGEAVPIETLSMYIEGGFTSMVCPDGGEYTIHPVGEHPTCSVVDHALD